MPGGFHPFHAGHMALYNSARKAFPDADLYVAATNSQEERPFPFAVKEKLAKVAGVEPGHFIQVKSPFQAKEITQHYNPEQDVLIFVRSEKDRNESPKPGGTKKDGSPAYFQPWTGKNVQPFGQHAYFAYLPTVKFGPGITSATEIRKAWPTLNDKRKTAMVMSLYPASQKNPKLAANIVAMLDQVMGGQVSEGLSDAVKGIKRKVAGKQDPKEVEHMYGRIARSAIKHKTPDQAEKDIQRYNRVAKVVNKEDVAEGLNDKPEAGDKIIWYHSNHYPKLEGEVVGWKDGHLIVKSIDPSPRNTEKTVATYRVPKNNILSVEKQSVAEGFGLPMPGTYEQEHDMDQKQSGHRTHDLTSESSLSESQDYLDEK